jgi:hypothetical protein
MREQILGLLKELDNALAKHVEQNHRLEMYLIGRGSLALRLELQITTDDLDMVQMSKPQDPLSLEEKALELFGEGTTNAQRLGLYLQRVPAGLPPIPHWFKKRCTDVPGDWRIILPKLLELHDFAVTKLKRFSAKDREDLKIMCDHNCLTPEGLRKSLDNAFAFAADEEEDPGRAQAYSNLKLVDSYLRTGRPSF